MTATETHRHGARMIDAGTARFTLWAPGRDSVGLELDGAPPVPMVAHAGGWFVLELRAQPGARYRFRIAPDLAVPDPASRLQDGDVHDASVLVGPDTFKWRFHTWRGRPWHETVLYEVHPGICGGYAGIQAMLPDLVRLGVTAVELMPIADFPGNHNWGYDGVLPYAPDAAYGSPDALKSLIDSAHGAGVMMFLDVVYNHFGPDGNYLPSYAPDFFRGDVDTPWGSAIDTRRPEVRRFFIDNAIYWLNEFHFDGLRFDAVHAINDHAFLRGMAREIRAAVAPDRYIHLVLENDKNDGTLLGDGLYDAQWADDTHHCLHVLLTGEQSGYYSDYPDAAVKLARCLAEGVAYQGEASAYRNGRPRGTPTRHLPPMAFVTFLQNHDQVGNRAFGERLTTLADPAALRAAILLVLLSPQIPLLFMGEDCGTTAPFLYFTDHLSSDLAEAVKHGRRLEFADFDATAPGGGQQMIPDPNDPATFHASIFDASGCRQDGTAWRALYRRLLAVRRMRIGPGIVGASSTGAEALGATGIRAAWRLGTGEMLTIAANFGDAPLACVHGRGEVIAAVPEGRPLTGTIPPFSATAWLAAP